MDEFDKKLKEWAKKEPVPLPEGYAERVFRTCAGLEEPEGAGGRSKRHGWRAWGGWAAAALAIFVALPNVSPTAAAAMLDIPVLSAVVEIITFHRYTYDDGHSSWDVEVPELGGGQGAQAVDDEIQAYTDQLMERFREDCEGMGENYQGLDVSSTVVTDSEQWFTLRIDAVETRASSYAFSRFYHIDKTTDKEVRLSQLFPEETDYVQVLSEEVRRQLEERRKQDVSQAYFPEAFTAIDPEQNFYFSVDGHLVLVFDSYTVAAGSVGMPEVVIPAEIYQDLLD